MGQPVCKHYTIEKLRKVGRQSGFDGMEHCQSFNTFYLSIYTCYIICIKDKIYSCIMARVIYICTQASPWSQPPPKGHPEIQHHRILHPPHSHSQHQRHPGWQLLLLWQRLGLQGCVSGYKLLKLASLLTSPSNHSICYQSEVKVLQHWKGTIRRYQSSQTGP